MPAVRFARDKRGYEYVYLVHTPQRRGKPGRQRVLYWYRTPPGVTIGRKPFDVDVQRALERQYPGVTFDWNTIVSTPMPPPDMTRVPGGSAAARSARPSSNGARPRLLKQGRRVNQSPGPRSTATTGPKPVSRLPTRRASSRCRPSRWAATTPSQECLQSTLSPRPVRALPTANPPQGAGVVAGAAVGGGRAPLERVVPRPCPLPKPGPNPRMARRTPPPSQTRRIRRLKSSELPPSRGIIQLL